MFFLQRDIEFSVAFFFNRVLAWVTGKDVHNLRAIKANIVNWRALHFFRSYNCPNHVDKHFKNFQNVFKYKGSSKKAVKLSWNYLC